MFKYDLIVIHIHHGCMKKKKKIEEMFVWNENENEKTPERAKMNRNEKWEIEGPQKGRIKKGVRSLWWKTQKFTLERLQMGSVFGYERVSFDKSPRTIVYCMIVCKHLHYVAFGRRICIIYQLYV